MSALGKKGFREAAFLSAKQAHKLAEKLASKGYEVLNKNFFNEFVLQVDDTDSFLTKLKENNILGGIKVDNSKLLIAATEMTSDEDIDLYINAV